MTFAIHTGLPGKPSSFQLALEIVKEGLADASEDALLTVVGVISKAQLVPSHDALVGFCVEDFKAQAHCGGGDGAGRMVYRHGDFVAFLYFLAENHRAISEVPPLCIHRLPGGGSG